MDLQPLPKLNPAMSTSTYQYRVVWRRKDWNYSKKKVFNTLRGVRQFLLILGPEPWKGVEAFKNRDADELFCCSGHECGCGGETIREHFTGRSAGIPPLQSLHVERRRVLDWKTFTTEPPKSHPETLSDASGTSEVTQSGPDTQNRS